MSVPNVDVNYLVILVCGVLQMIIGYFWYSQMGFGKQWMKALKLSNEQKKAQTKKGMTEPLLIGFLMALVLNFVLANIIKYFLINTFYDGMFIGFLLWLGFIVTLAISPSLWEGKSYSNYFINIGYYLVILLLNGGILAIWN